jgi:hypothetical protein
LPRLQYEGELRDLRAQMCLRADAVDEDHHFFEQVHLNGLTERPT